MVARVRVLPLPAYLAAHRCHEVYVLAWGEVVEFEAEIESVPVLQSIFYPWAKVNWMYRPEE